MSFTVVIPARYESTRLPGKPLADIAGLPMVIRVMQRARQSGAAAVCVATDDVRVYEIVREYGGDALMTRGDHASGTDRLQEVAEKLGLSDDHIIVNVQGDEPLIPPAVIDQVAHNLASHSSCGVATLCEPIERREDLFNPNIVKVVADELGHALYFSRAPIPWHRDAFAQPGDDLPAGQWWRHIGIYAYRAGFLKKFVGWPPARLELTESLEQLRAMANGIAIHVAPASEAVPGGVDTAEDLERMRALLA
ncbi:MAG: 3-deoxy-manno-octulosonate cytidylyltransferase [Alcanivoracaceae bacterium]|nr:3-deoxy-manno-octulosonate cytidylyltransferase [Alcanivoracaceae bacterium]